MICDFQASLWANDEQIKKMIKSQRVRFEGPGRVMIIREGFLACEHVLKGQIFEGNGIVFED